MTIFKSPSPSVGHYPDDVDLYSFLFEYFPSSRWDPRGSGRALLVDEETGQSWSFEDCQWRVDALALGLRDRLGIREDTVVALFSANCVDYLVAILACHKLGAVVSCANPAFTPSELAYQLDASKATVMFVGEEATSAGLAAAQKAGISSERVLVMQSPKTTQARGALKGGNRKVQEGAWALEGLVAEGKDILAAQGPATLSRGRRRLSPGEGRTRLAFLSFSSGTTGLPKGVKISHLNPLANCLQQFPTHDIRASPRPTDRFRPGLDVSLGCLPFYHIYGLVVTLLFVFYAGITIVAVPKFRGIEAMIRTALRYRITLWWLVPPQVVLLVKDPAAARYHEALRTLIRFLMVGAAPLSDELSAQLARILPGVDCGQGYGMTETCTMTSCVPLRCAPVLGSAGRLVSDVEALVVDGEGRRRGVGETGELWIRSPTNTLGYLDNDEATREMWVEGGWVRTGDEVMFNEEGDMFIVDRLKELIKVKGFQVAPAELEGWLLNHKDVGDVGVIGFPDERAGEVPLAFVALSQPAKDRLKGSGSNADAERQRIKASIIKFVADHKVKYKHLGGVEIIDAIPKTASGKILRRDLRDLGKKLPPLAGSRL